MRQTDRNEIHPGTGRISRRHKLFQPIEIIVGGRSVRAHILNISATGALVHTAADLASDVPIQLLLNGAPHPAKVVWRDARRFGMTFSTALGEALIRSLLR